MFINTIIIAAAGRGTRFGAATAATPKHLLPVLGKPFFGYVMEMVQRAGFERAVIVVDYLAEQFDDFFQTIELQIPITLVRQSQIVGDRYGSAAVFEAGATALEPDEAAVFVNGDSLFPASVLQTMRVDDGYNHLLVAPHDHPERYGVVDVDDSGILKHIFEKPAQPPSQLISLGLYACQSDLLPACRATDASPRGEYEITDALNALATGERVRCDQWSGDWVDYGRPEDLPAVEAFINKHYV